MKKLSREEKIKTYAKALYFKFKSGKNHITTPRLARQCAIICLEEKIETVKKFQHDYKGHNLLCIYKDMILYLEKNY